MACSCCMTSTPLAGTSAPQPEVAADEPAGCGGQPDAPAPHVQPKAGVAAMAACCDGGDASGPCQDDERRQQAPSAGAGTNTVKGGKCLSSAASLSSCAEDCCDQATPTQRFPPKNGDAKATSPDANCTPGCCGTTLPGSLAAKDAKVAGSEALACCLGKPAPCCDDGCLDRLALRDCETSWAGEDRKRAAVSCSKPTSACLGTTTRSACDGHRRAVRERYGATLEALGCICRALLALGQESCCETPRRSLEKKRCGGKKASDRSLGRVQDSCCAGGAPVRPPSAEIGAGLRKRADSCCADRPTKTASGCSGGSGSKTAKPGATKGACAEPDLKEIPILKAQDIENQAAGHEHVALCISGMTCTGCETKLNRTLATVAGVKNVKTSLVLSRAEFDMDLGLTTVDDVVKHLERTTEFRCERITNNGASIDVVVALGDASAFTNQPWPEGVSDMSVVDQDVVRVTFDPKRVGARDLVEDGWGQSARLAPARGDLSMEAGSKHVRDVGCMTLLSALFTVPVLVLAWAPLPKREIAYSSASLALATIVQVCVAGPFYPKALKALVFSRVIEMDLLIVLSTSVAYVFSVVSFGSLVAGKRLSTGQFFETSTLLVTLIMVGRYVAALARQKAVESISVRSLRMQTALLLVDETRASETREIDARLLQYGDVFKVLPDSRIPTDGTVVAGSSEVDESMLTGEPRPVEKQGKSCVIAGTVNGSGALVVRLTRLPGDNTIDTIAAMVDEAKLSKPKVQDLADRVASYFVPVIVALTMLTFVAWVAIGISVRGEAGSDAAVEALTYAMTVLIVSCPCAIGLAVPMVVVIASGVAAERGVIFKSADAIEVAHKAAHVVFDKTGTLTQGTLSVVAERCVAAGGEDGEDGAKPLLLALVGDSRHPVSVAVAKHLGSQGIVASSAVPGAKSLTGRGLEAEADGQRLRAGNSRWLGLSSHAMIHPLLAQGLTVFCFTIDDTLRAVYGLEDALRADAEPVVRALQSGGVSVHVVSGDDDGAVQSAAKALGIPGSHAHARSSPADKQNYVKSLLGNAADDKEQPVVVVFCGDGTNDAAALAQATVGVHMSDGSEVARSAADVVLVRPALAGILTMMKASKQSMRRIRFNFAWSLVYNVTAVLFAAGAFGKARIPPEFGGLGEVASVLPVVVAAVLLRWAEI